MIPFWTLFGVTVTLARVFHVLQSDYPPALRHSFLVYSCLFRHKRPAVLKPPVPAICGHCQERQHVCPHFHPLWWPSPDVFAQAIQSVFLFPPTISAVPGSLTFWEVPEPFGMIIGSTTISCIGNTPLLSTFQIYTLMFLTFKNYYKKYTKIPIFFLTVFLK